jgi:hypothetical protein
MQIQAETKLSSKNKRTTRPRKVPNPSQRYGLFSHPLPLAVGDNTHYIPSECKVVNFS